MEPAEMRLRVPGARLFALSAIGVIAARTLCAGSVSATLPLNVAPTLGEVQRFFADVTRRVHSGPDPAAQGSPKGTIASVFATADGKKTVTVTVAQYPSATAAYSAFRATETRAASGGREVAMPHRIGQRSFSVTDTTTASAAVVGALDGALVVKASLKGYHLDKTSFEKLVALTRAADELAVATLI